MQKIWERLKANIGEVLVLFGLGRGVIQGEKQSPLHLINDLVRRAFPIKGKKSGGKKNQTRTYKIVTLEESIPTPDFEIRAEIEDSDRVGSNEVARTKKFRSYQKSKILLAATLARSKRQTFRVVASCLNTDLKNDATTPPEINWADLTVSGITDLETRIPTPDWEDFKIQHYPLQKLTPKAGVEVHWAGEKWFLNAIHGEIAKLTPVNLSPIDGERKTETALDIPLTEIAAV